MRSGLTCPTLQHGSRPWSLLQPYDRLATDGLYDENRPPQGANLPAAVPAQTIQYFFTKEAVSIVAVRPFPELSNPTILG